MKRYNVNWGPFLGQAGGEVVCDGDVCRIVPSGTPAVVPVRPVAPVAVPMPPAADAYSGGGLSMPWLAVGAAAGIGLLVLALR